MKKNEIKLIFPSISENESFARMVMAAYITPLNPTLEEISDIKTAVSEAVTNCIIHGYKDSIGEIKMECWYGDEEVFIKISDYGEGIKNIEKAKEPMYTSRPDLDRSGMGFTFMEAFMDGLEVHSQYGKGTDVIMHKKIGVN